MVLQADDDAIKKQFRFGFVVVWTVGIVASIFSIALGISGVLWNLGFPYWLITLCMLVGIWQWVWIAPLLSYLGRTNRIGLNKGLRAGAIWFTLVQLSVAIALYFCFRNFGFH
jgi:hypothetical protein